MSVKYPNLDVNLICATITHESARTWEPEVVSKAGAMGLMQIMPATGEWLSKYEGITWTGAEENHRIDRAHAFVLRYAYLLDGLPLDKKAPGSFWTVRGLCKQMQDHFWHHTANVLEKMKLPDWPKK